MKERIIGEERGVEMNLLESRRCVRKGWCLLSLQSQGFSGT